MRKMYVNSISDPSVVLTVCYCDGFFFFLFFFLYTCPPGLICVLIEVRMGEACVYTYRTFINLVTAFLQNELSVVLTLMGTYTQLFLRVTECHQCQTLFGMGKTWK